MPLIVTTLKSGSQNSAITCLHTPQGKHSLLPPTIAMLQNSRSPSLIALKNAVLSAQTVGEKDAFSILHPVYTLPDLVRSAAPTLKLEYGEYELFNCSVAIFNSSLSTSLLLSLTLKLDELMVYLIIC